MTYYAGWRTKALLTSSPYDIISTLSPTDELLNHPHGISRGSSVQAHGVYLRRLEIQIRKSKDYVYGICVYKVPGIWKGYYRVEKITGFMHETVNRARNYKYMKYHSKLTHQLSFWNVSRKVDYHAGGKWFIHGPKRRKENQLLSLKHPCWLSLV